MLIGDPTRAIAVGDGIGRGTTNSCAGCKDVDSVGWVGQNTGHKQETQRKTAREQKAKADHMASSGGEGMLRGGGLRQDEKIAKILSGWTAELIVAELARADRVVAIETNEPHP